MNYDETQGLTMSNWHKCPNSLVDRLMGTVLSPNATCVVLTIWRLTEGVRERHQAAIPTETFMRVTKTNRKNTAYKYVDEAIKSGLISVKKEQGKVNVYSINKQCSLWYSDQLVVETVPTTESATSVDKCNMVVTESDTTLTQTSGGKRHTYKDIEIKDSIKDKKKVEIKKVNPKFDALSYPVPSFIKQENWTDFVAMRKEIKKPLTENACKRIVNKINEFDANGFDANESLDNSIANSYSGIFERGRKQQSTNQVNRHENNQPANNSNSQPSHFDKLRAEARAKYGNASTDTSGIRTVN